MCKYTERSDFDITYYLVFRATVGLLIMQGKQANKTRNLDRAVI